MARMTRSSALRATLALAVLACGLAAPVAHAQAQPQPRRSSRPAPAPDGGLRLGGLLGFEFGDGDTGLALRVDGEMPVATLAPNLVLNGVVSLGFSRFADETRDFRFTTNIVKVVPALRFVLKEIAPQFGLYGDAGLGLYYVNTNFRERPVNVFRSDDSGVGIVMRFAGGTFYDVNDRLRIAAELGVNPYFGDFDQTTVTLLAALTYRL
jgi:hypothetical protein